MDNVFYVYFHINPLTNKVFYVGKGKKKRAFSKKKRNVHWGRAFKKYGLIVDIVDKDLSEEKAFELECFYISWFGLKNLCNITIGGSGGDTISNNPNRDEIITKQKNYANGNKELLSKRAKDAWTDKFRNNQIEKQSKKPLIVIDLESGMPIFAKNSKELAALINTKASTIRTAKYCGWNIKKRYVVLND